MGPDRRFPLKERRRSESRRAPPSASGMGPETRPGERTSWVRSVRLAREGGSVPARPGDPAEPADPRVRDVTRRVASSSAGEQTTPAKEEQASEAADGESKRHEEKKPEPGRSRRLCLRSMSTSRSPLVRRAPRASVSCGRCCAVANQAPRETKITESKSERRLAMAA